MSRVDTRRVRVEILIVLAVTFGLSGVRAALRLADALLSPTPLNQQEVTLNRALSQTAWLDVALQVCNAAVLFAWGALALFLLAADKIYLPRWRGRDSAWGAALAAGIGIPGLALYVVSLHAGWTKEVIPASSFSSWYEPLVLLLWSAANAFGEEVVVVLWFMTRLGSRGAGLGWAPWAAVAGQALLRGSYHLYQGVSAGFGNVIMGMVFGYFYLHTGRVWPLIVAHFLIDAVAFVGYAAVGDIPLLRHALR